MNAAIQTIIQDHHRLPDSVNHPAPTVRLISKRSSNIPDDLFTRLKCDGYPDIAPDYLRQAAGVKDFLAIRTADCLAKMYAERNAA